MENETFLKMAIEKGKKLVVWRELEEEEKKEVMNEFDKYLIVFG